MSPDDDGWGFADMYGMEDEGGESTDEISDVKSDDWRNILVLGRASGRSVYPETLSLVGHAKYLADGLGCRVEVLLIGEDLDRAVEALKGYPVDHIYTVKAPDYAPIDHTSTILYEVVRKRRPELVLVFQSRTGDAITAYAATKAGAGFALGASKVDIDTMDRKTMVTHQGKDTRFNVVTQFEDAPAFVSVQRGLFRVPMEDPYSSTKVFPLDVDAGRLADIQVKGQEDPPAPTVENAERVVVIGSRIRSPEGVADARKLAERLDAVFAVTQAAVDRGLAAEDDPVIGQRLRHVGAARLVVAVGCTGSLDLMEALPDTATLVAVGSGDRDPINGRAAYRVALPEGIRAAVKAVMDGL